MNSSVVLGSRPSLGTIVGLPIAGFLVLAFIAAFVLGTILRLQHFAGGGKKMDAHGYMNSTFLSTRMFRIAGVVGLIVTLAITVGTYFPFSSEYHEWQTIRGTVEQVGSRLLASGDGSGSTQRFVVQFRGDSGQYSCDDTRCALVKVNDTLTISCKRAWQFTGTPGYDCNYVGVTDPK